MSILTSIKKLLGIPEDCTDFDQDIIIHINSVIMILNQIGVGNEISISDSSTIWSDLIEDGSKVESVKSYIYLKVRKLFDPPSSSQVSSAMDSMISELEWRLSIT